MGDMKYFSGKANLNRSEIFRSVPKSRGGFCVFEEAGIAKRRRCLSANREGVWK